MKTVTVTSQSSTISSSTSSNPIDQSEPRENNNTNCYFPGCRKDANCTCEICVASINATLDLIPSTARSKFSNPDPKSGLKSPIPYNSKILSTPSVKKPIPTSRDKKGFREIERREKKGIGFGGFLNWLGFCQVLSIPRSEKAEPVLGNDRNSAIKVTFCDNEGREKRDSGTGCFLINLILGVFLGFSWVLSIFGSGKTKPGSEKIRNLTSRVSFRDKGLIWIILVVGLVFGMELGFEFGVLRVLKLELSDEMVKNISENARVLEDKDLSRKLGLLRTELQDLVSGKVSDCGSDSSLWKIKQDDMLLNSKCILYKSVTEEVSIWGWPLQTAGLLTADFSSRSLTILSGRVTEWSFGKISNFTMKPNQSWTQQKWSASVVQLDPNTWIIEYKRARMVENPRLISATMEFLSIWFSRVISRIKKDFYFFPDFGSMYDGFKGESFKVPT